jgi:hypothetical protein
VALGFLQVSLFAGVVLIRPPLEPVLGLLRFPPAARNA